ncbi:MAG: universal stress protein [Rhodospirillales bacterium]|nr:universal stress protein [Rhodospirillales bacterium]
MALKDLLVQVDSSRRAAARLEAAIGLAVRHNANLVGVYVLTYPSIPGFIQAEFGEDVLRRLAEDARSAAAAAEADFNDRVARAGVSGEWRLVEGPVPETLALHARYCDLAVVGQRDPEGDETAAASQMPDRVILSLGRPVLVIPNVGDYPVVGERVMVAWDASRLATRAVHDALPLLELSRHVSVIAINPHGGTEGHGMIPSADICLHLARHGINVEAQHLYADDVDVGDMLLSRAADQAIDLLVMGAYGHARWRELVLGGATRHILNHMTMPVLMSH